MKFKLSGLLLLAILLAGPGGPAAADVLLIEEVRERQLRDLPENGLRMSAVEDRYGAPEQHYNAVGNPPITRWRYSDFSVYFEHDRVIESVLHHGAVLSHNPQQAETDG